MADSVSSVHFLYQFSTATETWRYNSTTADIVHDGATWTASSISHGNITQSGEVAKTTVSFDFPINDEFAIGFLDDSIESLASVTIWRFNGADYDVEWKGRIAGASATTEKIELEGEPVYTLLRRPGLMAIYQRSCPHTVYAGGCKLDKADFANSLTATAADGRTITITGVTALELVGGMIEYDGVLRMVTQQTGDTVLVTRPFRGLSAAIAAAGGLGVAITAYLGCDNRPQTCLDRFDNIENYGAFYWHPSKNPMGGSSII